LTIKVLSLYYCEIYTKFNFSGSLVYWIDLVILVKI